MGAGLKYRKRDRGMPVGGVVGTHIYRLSSLSCVGGFVASQNNYSNNIKGHRSP